jgi:hypothetical protein
MDTDTSSGIIGDQYHTVDELYSTRAALFIALMRSHASRSWKSKLHHDGSTFAGYFIAGMILPTGDISFHLENEYWRSLESIPTLEKSPRWDGYTTETVIERLLNWEQ